MGTGPLLDGETEARGSSGPPGAHAGTDGEWRAHKEVPTHASARLPPPRGRRQATAPERTQVSSRLCTRPTAEAKAALSGEQAEDRVVSSPTQSRGPEPHQPRGPHPGTPCSVTQPRPHRAQDSTSPPPTVPQETTQEQKRKQAPGSPGLQGLPETQAKAPAPTPPLPGRTQPRRTPLPPGHGAICLGPTTGACSPGLLTGGSRTQVMAAAGCAQDRWPGDLASSVPDRGPAEAAYLICTGQTSALKKELPSFS